MATGNTPAELEAAELRAELLRLQKKMEASGIMDSAAKVDFSHPAPDGGPQVVGYHKKVITQKYRTVPCHPVVDGKVQSDRIIKINTATLQNGSDRYISVAEFNGTVDRAVSEPRAQPEPAVEVATNIDEQVEVQEARAELLQMDMTLLRTQPECAEMEQPLPRVKSDLVDAIIALRFA